MGSISSKANNLLYSPIAFWHLEESSGNRVDDTNNGWTLSEGAGSVSNTTGKVGNAASFDGTTSKFLKNSSISLGSTFSISCWVKLNSYNPNNEKGIWGCGTSGNHLISLYIQNSNNAFVFVNWGETDIVTNFIPILNTWYHTVVTVNPNGAELYIDGNLIGSVVYPLPLNSSWTNFSLSNFYIDGPAGYPIDAVIDEVGIWDLVLTSDQILNLYNNPNALKFNKSLISVKKQNTGSGKINIEQFIPKDNLAVWLKADAGIIHELITPSFVNEVILTDSGEPTSDGTYTRSTGGTTRFDGPNGNYIYWDGAWIVYDNDLGIETYVNYDFYLNATSWDENNSTGAPSAVNTTSDLPSFQGITSWKDQSGNNRNFTKSIANTGYPKLSNGIPLFTAVITYDDSNASILALPSSSLNLTTPYTLIVLLRSGPGNSVVFSKSGNYSKRRKYQISINGGVIYSLESKNGLDTSFNYNTGTGDYRKRLIVCQYSSNTSGLIRYNGSQVATSSTDVGIDQTNNASVFIGASPFREGIGYNAEASNEMHVYEIIFYNRALSTTEIEKIETYLNNKYPSICGFQNTSKLNQINGTSQISRNFNHIVFDYPSFVSNCSSLGLDPTTILNSLGGVDFSYNYVVIRSKTSSQLNADSISDLGNGIINITNSGASFGVVGSYYRFFVMCREGWNTVRFYGTDYPI
jgi:hypothetical protein